MDENKVRVKAKALLEQLTLEEKVGMIHGAHLFSTQGVERLGIPPLVMSDGPMGVRQEFEPDHWKAVGYSDDAVSYLPCNSALAATWNRDWHLRWAVCLAGKQEDVGRISFWHQELISSEALFAAEILNISARTHI